MPTPGLVSVPSPLHHAVNALLHHVRVTLPSPDLVLIGGVLLLVDRVGGVEHPRAPTRAAPASASGITGAYHWSVVGLFATRALRSMNQPPRRAVSHHAPVVGAIPLQQR